MMFGFSTNLFTRDTLETALERIAAAGFRRVEILADSPHAELCSGHPEDYSHLPELLRSLGLEVCNVNANTVRCMSGTGADDFFAFRPSLDDPDPRRRRERLRYCRRAVRLAALLGSPLVTVCSGPPAKGLSRHESISILHDTLGELIDYADEHGVRVALEYEPGLVVGNAAAALSLIRYHRLLSLNLDVGHAAVAGEDVFEVMDAFAGRIANVHLEDIKGREHVHLPPGEGDLDLEGIVRALDEAGFEGTAVFELYSCADRPAQALAAAAAFARRMEEG